MGNTRQATEFWVRVPTSHGRLLTPTGRGSNPDGTGEATHCVNNRMSVEGVVDTEKSYTHLRSRSLAIVYMEVFLSVTLNCTKRIP